jgi:transposase
MTQKVYEEQILEKHIRPLLNEGRTFILEEDGDSGHGPGPKNRVRRWKEKHGLMYYFNCPGSPDLSPIENVWSLLKAKMRKYSCWDNESLKKVALDCWNEITQEAIDKLIHSMPKRLNNCIYRDGKHSGY